VECRFIVEHQYGALLLHAHPQPGAALSHFHIGIFAGAEIFNHAVTAAKS
jgi:hypothetical protein